MVNIIISEWEPETRIGGLSKAWNSLSDAFCAIHSNAPNVSFRNSLQCPIYIINSDKIKLSRKTPTEVASQFLRKHTPFVHLRPNIISYPNFCYCNGNVSYNRLVVKGVGTRLPTSSPLLVGRFEANRREVCRGSGITCRTPVDYPLQGYRELAAIELPMRQDHRSITEAYGGIR